MNTYEHHRMLAKYFTLMLLGKNIAFPRSYEACAAWMKHKSILHRMKKSMNELRIYEPWIKRS